LLKFVNWSHSTLFIYIYGKIFWTLPAGATKFTYAPEPFDVGQLLQAEIVLNTDKTIVQTDGPIENG
jgi:hypothetical protein